MVWGITEAYIAGVGGRWTAAIDWVKTSRFYRKYCDMVGKAE